MKKPVVSKGSENSTASNEVKELRMTVDTLERERDFYFGKLRDIEVLLQAPDFSDQTSSQLITKILYATEDEKVEIEEGKVCITPIEGDQEMLA
jgi:RP/EB family microtubule-associated protein